MSITRVSERVKKPSKRTACAATQEILGGGRPRKVLKTSAVVSPTSVTKKSDKSNVDRKVVKFLLLSYIRRWGYDTLMQLTLTLNRKAMTPRGSGEKATAKESGKKGAHSTGKSGGKDVIDKKSDKAVGSKAEPPVDSLKNKLSKMQDRHYKDFRNLMERLQR